MGKTYDLTGQKIGRLTVIKRATPSTWECFCSCGNTTIAETAVLRNGKKKSCGCLKLEQRERMRKGEATWHMVEV